MFPRTDKRTCEKTPFVRSSPFPANIHKFPTTIPLDGRSRWQAIKVDNCPGRELYNYDAHTISGTVALWLKVLSLELWGRASVGGDKGNYGIILWHCSLWQDGGRRMDWGENEATKAKFRLLNDALRVRMTLLRS